MKFRLPLLSGVLASALLAALSPTSAQEVTATALPDSNGARTANHAFSKDARILREIQSASGKDSGGFQSVRLITYDAMTGSINHLLNLGADTWLFSATADGRTAIISVDRDRNDARAHLLLVDTETGRTQDIPSSWFNAEDHNPYAQISADGRLVSAYSEWGPESGPLVVTLYDWQTKSLVAQRSEGFPAGGLSWGGVTADGMIEFLNNRSGGDVVDPKTGQVLVRVGPSSHRSLDGAWVVDFPNPLYEGVPRNVLIKNGRSGEVVGKLDLRIKDAEESLAWGRGAFCGTSGKFIAATNNTVQAFEIPSGKRVADFPTTTWQDADAIKTDPMVTVACSFNGKRVAIRSGAQLTLHVVK